MLKRGKINFFNLFFVCMDLLLLLFLFLAEISNHMYQLKTLGTQMGYPNGVLVWIVIKVNDKTIFGQFWRVKNVSIRLPIFYLHFCRFI